MDASQGPAGIVDPTQPLGFSEAEEKKHKQKLQEFKQFLVDTRVVQTLVSVLLGIKERETLPDDPQQVLIDYFGEYRDPVLNLIDELNEKKESLTADMAKAQQEIETLEKLKETLQEQSYHQRIWKALNKSGGAVTSLSFYQRLSDRKKPRGPLKSITFTQSLLSKLLASLPQGMPAQIAQLLCPSGDPMESVSSANLKDDGDNPIINAVLGAVSQFNAKDA